MVPSFDVDVLDFTKAVETFARETKRRLRDVLRDEFRLGMQTLARFTPPRSYKQGRARTSADIAKIYRSFNVDTFRDYRLKKLVESGNLSGWTAAMKHVRNPDFRGAEAVRFDPSEHKRARDRRGRIRKRGRNRWAIGADADRLRAYRKKKDQNVGLARSGWSRALLAVGGKNPPKWIRRHGTNRGAIKYFNRGTDREAIEAANATPWAGNKEEGNRQVSRMYRQRAKSIERKLDIFRDAARVAGLQTA